MIEFNDIMMIVAAVAVLAFFIIGGTKIIDFFQKTTTTMNNAGTQSAMSYALLSSPELSYKNSKNIPQKFIFNKIALDRNNNSKIPGMDFKGSYYFIEIDDSEGTMWRFSNTDMRIAANARVRGILPADEPAIYPCSTVYATNPALAEDPFQGLQVVQFPVAVADGERMLAGSASLIIDPDSSYGSVNYPLCICDIACPADNGCRCPAECPIKTEISAGQKCS